MLHSHPRPWTVAAGVLLAAAARLSAADHGPVFGLATPTNPQGGWSFDLGVNGRGGAAGARSALEAELSYGVTRNLKLAVSGPVVFQPDPYARSSVTENTPISGNFSGLAWWRFQKKDFAGKRFESTAVGGILAPGPQREAEIYQGLHSGVGYLVGAVTGVASRSQYVWVGSSYQRYAESSGDRRPDLLSYTAVYGYRPLAWRTDYPRWDWRIFAEFTGERAGTLERQMIELPGSRATQMFLGPSVLGVYRAIGVEAGIQFPMYQDVGPILHEKGYTPKTTTVSARGDVTGAPGRLQLKVSGTRDILNLAPDPKNAAAYDAAAKKIGQVVIQGIMTPGKDLKVATPVEVTQVQ